VDECWVIAAVMVLMSRCVFGEGLMVMMLEMVPGTAGWAGGWGGEAVYCIVIVATLDV
jgi:hypothetical protein